MRAIGALVAVIVLSSAPAWADSTTDNKQLADKLFLEGREQLAKEQFEAACTKFLAAQELEKDNVALLLNLGLCYEKQDKRASALRWYRKTRQIASEKNDPALREYEDTARDRTQALSQQVSKVTFSFAPGFQANAEIFLDGETISRNALRVEVDRGTHVVEARAPGKKTSRNELIVEDNTKELTYAFAPLEAAPVSANRSTRRLIGLSVGGGVIAVATVVSGLWARSREKDLEKAKDPMTGDPDRVTKLVDEGQLKPTIVFVSGLAVGVGIAAYFFFTKPKVESQTMAITPVVGDDQVGVSLFRRF